MTSHSDPGRESGRRIVIGALAGGALAVGLVTGLATPAASAQPATPTTTQAPAPAAAEPKTSCTGEDCHAGESAAPAMSADRVLALIYDQYRQGDGGGQVSTLIDDAMKLRQLGFRPSNANAAALVAALDKRPNQTPLVQALQDTIAYQRKLQAQAANQAKQPVVSAPGGSQVPMGPSWAPGNPMIKDPDDNPFPMPGRS